MTQPTEERYTGLAREVRILMVSALGSWSKVLQLVVLLLVLATSIAILIAGARFGGQGNQQEPSRVHVGGAIMIDQAVRPVR